MRCDFVNKRAFLKAAELRRMLHAWGGEMNARMPEGEPRDDYPIWIAPRKPTAR